MQGTECKIWIDSHQNAIGSHRNATINLNHEINKGYPQPYRFKLKDEQFWRVGYKEESGNTKDNKENKKLGHHDNIR
eukprot:14167197-Heterocapsa_arctica.AAC.1